MPLEAQLNDEHKQAMKRRDQRTADVIRMIKVKIAARRPGKGYSGENDDARVLDAISAHRVELQRALDEFYKAGSQGEEHADALVFEIAFCERFLPKSLDETALRALVVERIAALGITDAKQADKVISDIVKTHKWQVRPTEIRQIAVELLKG